MFTVMLILLTCGLFVMAGYAAANGDLPLSGRVADRKTTFAAAEAGVNFYQFHLNQDNDYWLKCTNVAKPNATENSPVNQEWISQTGTDPRTWRTIPGSTAQYTIELLPNPADTRKTCVENDGKSMLDPVSNVFRVRVTGKPTATSKVRRSIIATFRRTGFLDFLYFTNYEDLDPSAYAASSDRANANAYCADRPRAQRTGWPCAEITFANQDAINGPLHSNDTLRMCGSPTFGRDAKDRVTVYGPSPGWISGCAGTTPNFKSPLRVVTKSVDMPSSNDELKNIVQPAYRYYGRTTILFQTASPGKMQVTNSKLNGGAPLLVDVPTNGVVYVDNDPAGTCTGQPPTAQTYAYNTYTEATACGNLYVSGTYSRSMTLAAANDIIVKPYDANCTGGTCNGDLIGASDAVMGLIANQFVRVYHPCTSSANQRGYMQTVRVEAAILSLKHSFIADNYNCGNAMGKLTVVGAIAQKYRGAVGTFNGTTYTSGYQKDYWYDDRLKYRTPPYFLQPTSSAWNVIRFNEQLKPR
jgi:Tfp pilus assembly protein PilX